MQEPRIGDYVILSSRLEIGKVINVCTCDMCKERGYLEPILDNKNIFITDYDRNNSFHGYEIYEDVMQLIRPGDYVNGTKVTMIAGTRYDKNDLHCYCDYCENKETRKWLMIPAKEIKSIVTKEQFESMEYKVGDDKE